MAIVQTKWIDVGYANFYGTVVTGLLGTGTLSNTQNGSSDVNLDSVYSGADVSTLTHASSSGGYVTFSLTGNRANGAFDTLKIGGVSFARTTATYSYNSNNNRTTWTWSSISSSPFGTTAGADKQVTWETAGATVTAPVISGVSNNNAAAATVTATISLSSSGSGGTLQYAQTTSNSAPSSGWSAAPAFSHPRGATRYYWARRDTNTVTSSVSHSVGYLTGDIGFSKTSPTITSSASSATTTIQYATAGETLAIRLNGQSTNLVTAVVASNSQSQNISFSSSLPSAGSSSTYRFFVRRPTSTGGDGSTFVDTNGTFTVTRAAAAPAAPTNLTFSTATTASSSTNVTVTASGGGTGTLKVSADGSTWYANGTSFGSRARGTAHTWYARVESTLNSSNYTEAHTPPYLSPATGTAANDTILSGASSHTGSISGGTAGTVYEFRSGGYTGTILATVNGNGSATCSGGAGTYYVTHYKTTGTGGSGTAGRANLTTYTVSAVSKQTFTIKINYIPAETGTPPTLFAPTVTVDAGSITGSVTSSSNPLEVSVGDDVIWKKNLVQNTVTVGAINNFTSTSNIAVTVGGVTRTLANGTNNTDAMTVTVDGGGNGSASDTYYIERVGGIDPPSGLSSSLSGNESQTETVSLSLSTSGSNGTLEYLQRTVTSMSSTGWQTSNQFSQPRNTTRYYYASRNRNSGSFTGPLTVTVNYLGAVTTGYSFDTASGNIGYGDGAPAISFTAAQANHTVAVFEGSTARSSGVTGTTDHNNIATNETPPAGGSNTYNLRTLRNSAAGGNPSASYVATDAGTIEIKRFPQTPTLSYTDNSASVESATTTATLTLSNTDGASTYWFRRVNDGTSFGSYVQDGNNVVTYTDQTRAANQAYDYQGRIVGANGLVSESAVINAQQLLQRYLAPKAFNYATPATISYGATSHTLTITGADSDHTYGWGIGVVGKGNAAYSGSSTITISSNSVLPTAGGENNYAVSVTRGTTSGGSGALVTVATNLNVKRYPQTPSGLTTFTDGGTAAASGTFTIAAGALDGASSTTITLSSNYTTNAVANGSAIANVARAGDIIYARSTGANGLTAQAAISTPATYLDPDLSVTASNVSITNTATSASTTIGGMTAGQTVAIRLNNGTTNLATRVGNGALSFTSNLPTYGNSTTYELFTSRPTTAGGSAAFVATNDTFTVTRAAANSAPTAFDFTNQTTVPLSNTRTSANTVTIAGLSSGTSLNVSVSGGTYSKNGAGYSSANTTAVNGDTFKLRHTSSGSYSTATTTTLTVGTGTGSFVSTTLPADTIPTAFDFTNQTNVPLSSTRTSANTVTIAGLTAGTSTAVSISGGTYSKNGAAYSSSNTTAVNGDTFTLRHTSSGSYSTSVTTTLTVGGVSGSFVSTTTAPTLAPNSFTFTDVSSVDRSAQQTSNTITVAGLSSGYSTSVSVSGGTYSKNGAAYSSSNTTAVNGDTFTLRHTSSSVVSTAVNTTLTIGGVSDTFTSTTTSSYCPTTNTTHTITGITTTSSGTLSQTSIVSSNHSLVCSLTTPYFWYSSFNPGSAATRSNIVSVSVTSGGGNVSLNRTNNSTAHTITYTPPAITTESTAVIQVQHRKQTAIYSGDSGSYQWPNLNQGALTTVNITVTICPVSQTSVSITSVDDVTPVENSTDVVTASPVTASGVTISSYAWTTTDIDIISLSSSTVQSPTLTFKNVTSNQTATIGVTVTDSTGATATASQAYTVQFVNQAPIASITGASSVLVNTVANFDGSTSYDPDGTTSLTFAFSASIAGSTIDTQSASSTETYSFTPTSSGQYTISLTVSDGTASTTTTKSLLALTNANATTSSAGGYGFEIYNAAGATVIRSDELIIRKAKIVSANSSGAASTTITGTEAGTKILGTTVGEDNAGADVTVTGTTTKSVSITNALANQKIYLYLLR